jgi:chaperonin GroES
MSEQITLKLKGHSPEVVRRFSPMGDHLLIIECDAESTWGELLIPDTARIAPQFGSVVAAGPDAKLAVGTTVVFPKYSGTEIRLGRHGYLFINESTVISTYTPFEVDATSGLGG